MSTSQFRPPRNGTPEQFAAHARHKVERQIVFRLIDELLDHGYSLRVFDGREYKTGVLRNKQTIRLALFKPSFEYLHVYRPNEIIPYGFIELVYGRNGHDVMEDWATCLEEDLPVTFALVAKLSGA